jgi:HSP20 family protein
MLVRSRPLGVRLRPFDWTFDRTFDGLVDSFLSPSRVGAATPAVTSTWEDGALRLAVDLPGVPQEAVDVSVAGRALTLSVKTDALSWQRTLSLGSGLDPEQVAAHYADGRLTIVVSAVPAAEPRRIEIQKVTVGSAPTIESAETAEAGSSVQDADTTATS